MKLRNKKTGEIGHFTSTNWNEIALIIMDDNGVQLAKYSSLAELNEEWEDAPEEPKEYWYIDIDGRIMSDNVEDDTVKVMREIGNYFETKEEAGQAVEKLKAWKRLKDKGFVFKGVNEDDGSIKMGLSKGVKICESVEFYEDMTLLFGGEE